MNYFQEMIKEICDEEKIKFELISKEWIIKLTKNDVSRYIVGSKFPLNSQANFIICKDKYATYEVLRNLDIPIVEHRIIYNKKHIKSFDSDLKNMKEFQEYINKNGKIIIKNACGAMGEDVYMAKDVNKVKTSLKRIFERNDTAVVSPFVNIQSEYRVICLENNVELIFEKIRPENSWKHNLSQGAKAKLIDDEKITTELSEFAFKVMKAIDAKFASVDLIRVDNKIMVLEVNSSVSMTHFANQIEGGREIAKEIYKKALSKIW